MKERIFPMAKFWITSLAFIKNVPANVKNRVHEGTSLKMTLSFNSFIALVCSNYLGLGISLKKNQISDIFEA